MSAKKSGVNPPSILISGQKNEILEFKGTNVSQKYSEITRRDVLDEAGAIVGAQHWLVRGYLLYRSRPQHGWMVQYT
jgi:hypothetical protein